MNLEKTSMQSHSEDAAVRWVAGPGRKPKLTPQELTGLSEADRENIRKLIQKRTSLSPGPNRRREQVRIACRISRIRHRGKYTNSASAKKAKANWLAHNREKRLAVNLAYYYRTRSPLKIRVLKQTPTAIRFRLLRKRSVQFCLSGRLRVVMRRALHRQFTRKSARTFDLIGCSPVELRSHIESLFLPGMSWDNRSLWHVDHKKPLASFDLRDPAQQRLAFHFTNLQPLWARDNQSKGARTQKPAELCNSAGIHTPLSLMT